MYAIDIVDDTILVHKSTAELALMIGYIISKVSGSKVITLTTSNI